MKSLLRLLLISLLLHFYPADIAVLFADDRAILITGDLQLKIADAFLDEGEYYRAVTEYKRFLILFPNSGTADYASFKIGMAYFQGEEYGQAARSFLNLRQKYPGCSYTVQAGYLEGISQWKMKNYDSSRKTLEEIAERNPQSEYAPRSLLAICLAALEAFKAEESRQALQRFLDRYPEHPGKEKVEGALVQIDRLQKLPEKSPLLAGIMSALLPGSGYLYAERYGDGITAFVINGLFIAGTLTAVHQAHYALAGIVGGVGTPFYLGNIYGSANAAKKWNLMARKEIIHQVYQILAPLL